MTESQIKQLKDKADDYRRFAFILIALSGFLMIGTVLPKETMISQSWLLAAVGGLLVLSVSLHGISVKTQQLLLKEED
ncbi:hypothetical protein HXA35_08200 [Bacillus sp. A301a_S52]|nr:hypothetical protein [Bacillus sp. A301a_S52]